MLRPSDNPDGDVVFQRASLPTLQLLPARGAGGLDRPWVCCPPLAGLCHPGRQI